MHSHLQVVTYLDGAGACWWGLREHSVYKDVLKVKGVITNQSHHYTILWTQTSNSTDESLFQKPAQ